MQWANFLHIYHPAEQQADILEAIAAQSYRPIINHLTNNKHARLTFNINGALTELLDKYGYRDLLDQLRALGERGQIEFTGAPKYHAFLPFLEENEIIRQIEENNKTNKYFLGQGYAPKGFFPTEMAYKESLAPLIKSLGFEGIILDEIASGDKPGTLDYSYLYKIENSDLFVFLRERRLSNLIMSAVVRSKEPLKEAMKSDLKSQRYVVTAMDGETFGHHRPGLEKMLFDILNTKDFKLVTLSDLIQSGRPVKNINPIQSTWASSEEDIKKGIQFLSWSDPENSIHSWQWMLTALALHEVRHLNKNHPRFKMVRQKMDLALASDHFWWASAKPWWSVEMIEDGAYRLLEVIRLIPEVKAAILDRARDLYERIISTAFHWQRTGKIRTMMQEQRGITRIPFKERTIGKGGAERGVYHAFLDMMQRLETEAKNRGEYEKAILWRDAQFKLENKLDIYDTVNAIDLLRVEIPHTEVESVIEKYKEKYRAIRGGQPEQRGN